MMHVKASIEDQLADTIVLGILGFGDIKLKHLASVKAKEIQSKLLNQSNLILNNKSSHYNKDIKMDCCEICKSTNNLETHHINEQKDADNNNNINHFHKNIILDSLNYQYPSGIKNYIPRILTLKEEKRKQIMNATITNFRSKVFFVGFILNKP